MESVRERFQESEQTTLILEGGWVNAKLEIWGFPSGIASRRCGGPVTLRPDVQEEDVDVSQKSMSLAPAGSTPGKEIKEMRE